MISGATGLPLVWGATPDERQRAYPADTLVPDPVLMTRAISVAAPTAVTWRWLCQIAVAPYCFSGVPAKWSRGSEAEERRLRGVGPTTGSTTAAGARRAS